MNYLDKLKKLAGLKSSDTETLKEDIWDDKLAAADATQKMMHQDYELDQFEKQLEKEADWEENKQLDKQLKTATADQKMMHQDYELDQFEKQLEREADWEANKQLKAADATQKMMHQDYELDNDSSLSGLQSKNAQQNQDQVVQAVVKGDEDIAKAEVKAADTVANVQQAQTDADVQIKKIEADAVAKATQVGVNKDVNVAAAIDGSTPDLEQLATDTDPNALGRMEQEDYDQLVQDTMTELLSQYSGGAEEDGWTDDVWAKVWADLDQMDVDRANQEQNIEWLDAYREASDTDDFGTPLQTTDEFGNYQFDDRTDNRNFSLDHQAGISGAHNFESVNNWLSGMFDDSQISVINEKLNESPEYADVIKTMRNAGLSHDVVMARITEWANTPEGVGETEPREHGDAYDMAQGVNLSLKRYMDAEDMKVTVTEHSVERMNALYENFKKKS
jgi:hypothetical protein